MARCFWLVPTLSALYALGACSSAVVPAARRADGSWHLQCGASLNSCVQRAGDLCRDRGYVVLGGMSKKQLYGAELGVSQVAERQSELDIACADRRGELPTVLSAQPTGSAAPPAPPAPVSTVSSAPRVSPCTPGATQRCVGGGACMGGQACLPDGSGFTACDCGVPPKPAN
ncbi:MAG: hypothetical protein ABJB12_12630 [Pseudomonadota bacterium]